MDETAGNVQAALFLITELLITLRRNGVLARGDLQAIFERAQQAAAEASGTCLPTEAKVMRLAADCVEAMAEDTTRRM